MGRYSRLGKNTVLVFVGNIGSKLIYLILLPFYTSWFSTADYGSTDLIGVYSSALIGIVSCCIFESVFIFPKGQSEKHQREYLSSALLFLFCSLSLYAVLCCIACLLSSSWNWNVFFIDHIWLIFGMVASLFIQQVMQQFARAIDCMVVYSTTGIVHTATIAITSFLLIPWLGVIGYALSAMAGGCIAALYVLLASKSWRFISIFSIRKRALKEMLKYSVPLIPNNIMWFLLGSFSRPVMEHYTGLSAVGVYAVAFRIACTTSVVFSIFQQAWVISAIEESRKEGYEQFYNKMLKIVVTILVLYTIILSGVSKWIIELFTTPNYYHAYLYIPILAVSVLFSNIGGFVGANYATCRKSKYYFYSTVWAGTASVGLNFLLIPIFSIWGAVYSMLISQLINMGMRIKYSWKIVHITDIGFYIKNAILLFVSIAISLFVTEDILRLITTILLFFCFCINNHSLFEAFMKKLSKRNIGNN